MQRTVSSIDRDKLGAEVAQLEALGLNELRARWRQLYETVPPPRFSRDLLRRARRGLCGDDSLFQEANRKHR